MKNTNTLFHTVISTYILALFYSCGGIKNVADVEIITSDIDNFWEAYEQYNASKNPHFFDTQYIEKGSDGVGGFIKLRIQNGGHLAITIERYPNYYKTIETTTKGFKSYIPEIKTYLKKFKELYPSVNFAPIYLVIGAMNAGGTTSNKGIIIGSELYALTDNTNTSELTDWHKNATKRADYLPTIIIHELVHIQQNTLGSIFRKRTLLSESLKEGSADFISELITGTHINKKLHAYANEHKTDLIKEFKSRFDDKNYKDWFYTPTKDRPNDLGYWIGYEISKAYYDAMEDKNEAIKNLMESKNPKEILEVSGL